MSLTAALLLAAVAAAAAYIAQPIGGQPGVAPLDGADAKPWRRTFACSPRTENLDRAAAYVAEQLRSAGARVSGQAYHVGGAGQYRNVIGSLGPETRDSSSSHVCSAPMAVRRRGWTSSHSRSKSRRITTHRGWEAAFTPRR